MKSIFLSITLAALAAPDARDRSPDVPFKNGFPVTSRARIYELKDIKRGDRGVGYTVFAGSKVEPFTFEVLGVMESLIGPQQDIILARLSGRQIEFTGVISGMSGSPVFIDGRLVGAVSYRIGQFTREPIAGITPIRSMLALYGDQVGPPRRTPTRSAGAALALGGQLMGRPWVGQTLDRLAMRSRDWPPWPVPNRAAAGRLRPIDTPISIAGLDPHSVGALATQLEPAGFQVVAGGSMALNTRFSARDPSDRKVEANRPGSAGTVAAAPIAPGAPVAVVMMRGTVSASALCTVTMVERDRVYGCGHSVFGNGHVRFPMATAAIINTLASEAGSFKQSAAAREVGFIDQDRLTAVAGRLGRAAPMVPVRIGVHRRDQARKAATVTDVEIVDSELWTPVMLNSVISSAINRRLGFEAGGTLRFRAKVSLGDRELTLVDTFSAPPPTRLGNFAAGEISGVVGLLLQNEFARALVRGIDVEATVDPDVALVQVRQVTPDRTWVRPGDKLGLSIELKPFRQPVQRVSLSVPIPRDATGEIKVMVGGGIELDRRDNAARGGRVPTDLDELIELLMARRSAKTLAARVYVPAAGLRSKSTVLFGLPPTAQATFRGSPATTAVLKEIPGPEVQRSMPTVVVGGQELKIEVRE